MKEICLVRHAKSSWKYPDLDDFERPLKKRGRKDISLMGKVVNGLGFLPDLVISSPAARAAITARAVATAIDYPVEEIMYMASIYEAGEKELIRILSQLDENFNCVMLVGHNPSMTLLANTIGNRPISNLPTSGIYCVKMAISSWTDVKKTSGKLQYFEFPRKYK